MISESVRFKKDLQSGGCRKRRIASYSTEWLFVRAITDDRDKIRRLPWSERRIGSYITEWLFVRAIMDGYRCQEEELARTFDTYCTEWQIVRAIMGGELLLFV
ncbi:hypothetical protein J6590_058919 [Homalodisca vitripennis]|nr:hypothetical protein J6590_058919 [Homalodisca vitripennis]